MTPPLILPPESAPKTEETPDAGPDSTRCDGHIHNEDSAGIETLNPAGFNAKPAPRLPDTEGAAPFGHSPAAAVEAPPALSDAVKEFRSVAKAGAAESHTTASQSTSAVDGISRAELYPWMKKAPESGSNRLMVGQDLPGRLAFPAAAGDRPQVDLPAPAPAVPDPQIHPVPAGNWSDVTGVFSRSAALDSAQCAAPEPLPNSSPSGILRELAVAIPNRAVEFKRSGAEALTVVLRPDSQTAIHLQLHGRDGQVAVQAQLERGDLQALNAQWGELQQTLSVQGIHLGELNDSSAKSFFGGEPPDTFARPERDGEKANLETSTQKQSRILALPKASPAPALVRTAPDRSWESWA